VAGQLTTFAARVMPIYRWPRGNQDATAEMPPGPVSFLVTASLTAAAHLPAYRVCGGVGSSALIPDLPVFAGNGDL